MVLNLNSNESKDYPKDILLIPNLEVLDLSQCRIERIPKDIVKLKKLKPLNLSGNLYLKE